MANTSFMSAHGIVICVLQLGQSWLDPIGSGYPTWARAARRNLLLIGVSPAENDPSWSLTARFCF